MRGGREREVRSNAFLPPFKGVGVKWTEGNVILRASCATQTESTFPAAAAATTKFFEVAGWNCSWAEVGDRPLKTTFDALSRLLHWGFCRTQNRLRQ